MAKFERTLSGEFEDIVYSIEDYFTQNENIKLVDKVFIRDGSIKCFTIVFDKYNKYLENKMSLTITLFNYSGGLIRMVAIISGIEGEEFIDEEIYKELNEII